MAREINVAVFYCYAKIIATFLISCYLVLVAPQNVTKNQNCSAENFFGLGSNDDVLRIFSLVTKEIKNINQTLSEMRMKVNGCHKNDKSSAGPCVEKAPKTCADISKCGHRQSGIYRIDPDGNGTFEVFCDLTTAGGGWTVFQKRLDGTVNFFRGWHQYKEGFGNITGEHWLGLDKIHRLSQASPHSVLRVELEYWDGEIADASYSDLIVEDESSRYNLFLGSYIGTAGDSMSKHQNMAFTTYDNDNDLRTQGNCAVRHAGGWWYNNCCDSNLNGLYYHGHGYPDGVSWLGWKSAHSNKRVEMKLRPASFVLDV